MGELGREFPLRVQSHKVAAAADFVDVRQLALRVDLAHTPAGVDEEHFPLGVHDDAGSRVSRSTGCREPVKRYDDQARRLQRTSHGAPAFHGIREDVSFARDEALIDSARVA